MDDYAYLVTAVVPVVTFLFLRTQNQKKTGNSSITVKLNIPQTINWFVIGLSGLFVLSTYLRFRDLGRFNKLMFDETHFVKFANKYLNRQPVYDVQPPFAKYMIAGGIWIGTQLGWGQDNMNDLAGNMISTISYRWVNATLGSIVPIMIVILAYQLTGRRSFALITGYLVTLDGFLILGARYTLLDIILVFWGLFGQICLLRALELRNNKFKFHLWLTLAGIGFGLVVSCKWNGMGLWGPMFAIWLGNLIVQKISASGDSWLKPFRAFKDFLFNLGFGASISFKVVDGKAEFKILVENIKSTNSSQPQQIPRAESKKAELKKTEDTKAEDTDALALGEEETLSVTAFTPLVKESPLAAFGRLNGNMVALYLFIIPFAVYVLQWVPHLTMNTERNILEEHRQMIGFHKTLAAGSHSYCSSWYTWPLLIRPMCYHYIGHDDKKTVEDIHSIGNPFLWWAGTFAMCIMFLILVRETLRWIFRVKTNEESDQVLPSAKPWVPLFTFLNWGACIFPFTMIRNCGFMYHYMPASVYPVIALAWLVDNWLRSRQSKLRIVAMGILFLVAVSFVFFAPILYGTTLTRKEFNSRMLFTSWI